MEAYETKLVAISVDLRTRYVVFLVSLLFRRPMVGNASSGGKLGGKYRNLTWVSRGRASDRECDDCHESGAGITTRFESHGTSAFLYFISVLVDSAFAALT